MAIDLNRFIATFFDEAQEHLESIEEQAMERLQMPRQLRHLVGGDDEEFTD